MGEEGRGCPVPAMTSSATNPLQDTAEPTDEAGGTSGKTYLREKKKIA